MPVAVAIQTGGLSTFLAFGMDLGSGKPMAGRFSPAVQSEPAVARVIDIAPQQQERQSLPVPQRQVLAYTRPALPGQAPQLWMTSQPTGQLIDVTA